MGWIQRTEADGLVTYTATKEGTEKLDEVVADPKKGGNVGMIACTLELMMRRGDIREDENGNVYLTEQGMNKEYV
ncbi:MAG: hypothetical protein KGH60_03845 [Candidatus Micrarchaeota archaeon]|nr:hypothetical protein [Candidatus Micrarchaeota archaeon]